MEQNYRQIGAPSDLAASFESVSAGTHQIHPSPVVIPPFVPA